MTVLSTLNTPMKTGKKGVKRVYSGSSSPSKSFSAEKRARHGEAENGSNSIQLRRPKKPMGEPWPIHDLRAFDAPTEETSQINDSGMLRKVLKARGWRYSTKPCHGTVDEESGGCTFFVKEFEACLRGERPEKIFGKRACVEDGYRLQSLPLPKHALWFMGWLPFRVPGTANESARFREDFVKIVVEHGDKLTGKPGNYRMAKFPHTETLCYKNNLTEAFKDKPWYPTTYDMPRDKVAFLKEIRDKGNSRSNYWIGKPRNNYGGTGICVWRGTDPEVAKVARESDNHPRSLIQRYLADPLLIGGYKFHMRIHLVLANVSPLEAYVQENGQCLFATKPYTLSGKTLGSTFDPPVHVTNMGLNAKPENKENYFTKKPVVGRGQQIRMHQLVSYLAEEYPSFDKKALWQDIISIAKDTAIYFAKGIQRKHKVVKDRHFEIFGMDLMLDKDMGVHMCEVNTDPGLGYPDEEVLGSPNPDYQKEFKACEETFHDLFTLLGLDAGREQSQGSLRHWFEVDFSDVKENTRPRSTDSNSD
jgi:hypothetical protein